MTSCEDSTKSDEPEPPSADPLPEIAASPGKPTAERAAPEPGPFKVGAVIDHYEIIRELGRGGMGIVFLARDTKLGCLVALKILTKPSGTAVERFLREARRTARCKHENIVVIHRVDEHDDHPYMVLEYIEGQSLRAWMKERRAANEDPAAPMAPVPVSQALDLMVPVVRALRCAHKRGIVHCDLKPENVMLDASGPIKVLDFGIAKLLQADLAALFTAEAVPPTGEPDLPENKGKMVGTVPFMSPEQWGAGEVDHRTDLWAAGIMLYELVTGAHPLAPLSWFKLAHVARLNEPMPKVGDARPGLGPLAAVIDRCLQKRKNERFATADDLLSALESARPGQPVPGPDDANPFTGLAAFQKEDADRFFGRELEVTSAVGRLRHHPLLAIVGPSGAGKSSFVRAGMIPALGRSGEDWVHRIVRPGPRPLAALAEALAPETEVAASVLRDEPGYLGSVLRARCRKANLRFLLFVDQFEELYTLGADQAERAAFVANLAGAADDAASPLRVVLSIRSDFFDRIGEDRKLMTEVTRGILLLPPMGRDGLREALTRPLEAPGYRFESDEMVDAMLGALERTRSPLPLLQFTAATLWEKRDRKRRLLTQDSYKALGGVAGALSGHADAVFVRLPALDQRLCRAVFVRLCTPERTRAVVSLAELRGLSEDGDAVVRVVHELAETRLLHLEGTTVELAHESLIERWATLKQWLDESTQDAQLLGRLRAAAQQWEASGKAKGLLWRDRAAQEAEAWLERGRAEPGAEPHLGLGEPEKSFLLAVVGLAERSRRVRRWIAAEVLLSLVVATMSALLIPAAQENDRRREVLEANEYAARWVAGTVLYKLREYRDAAVQASKNFPPELVEALRRKDAEPKPGDPLEGYCHKLYKLHERREELGSGHLPFDGWFIVGKEGRVRARWPQTEIDYLGNYLLWRDYFHGAWTLADAGLRSAYVSRAHLSEITKRQRFTLSAPIYDERGEWIGVIVGMTVAGATMGTLQLKDPNDKRHIAMVVAPRDNDRAGMLAALPRDHVILVHDSLGYGETTTLKSSAPVHEAVALAERSNPDRGLEQLMLAGPEAVISYEGFCDPVMDGPCDQVAPHAGRWLAGLAPVGNTGFVAIVETPRDAAARPNETLAGRFLLWAGLPFAVGSLVLGLAAEYARRRSARKYRCSSGGT